MRRWTLRISLVLLAILVLLAVVVQVVLQTNLPKNLVLGQLQKQLGLRVSAASLSTGWLGNTSLNDVTMALPLSDESFLDVPRMRVSHTSLPMLLLFRSVTIDSIELDRPNLAVRRDAAGRWNLADVAELVARAGGKKDVQQSGVPRLPAVKLTDGTIDVKDFNGQSAKLAPLNVDGRPRNPLVYRYDVQISDRVSLVGEVAPGGDWKHEVEATLKDVAEWIKPWVAQVPPGAKVSAQWRGQLDGNRRVAGRLQLHELKVGDLGAKGSVALRDNGGGSFVAEPNGLVMTTEQAMAPELRLASGRITADAKALKAERLLVAGIGGQARLDGNYAFGTRSGDLYAEWQDLMVPQAGMKQLKGSLTARLTTPFPNRPQVAAKLVSRGQAPDGPWDAALVIDGNGRTGWSEMDWTLRGENLDWHGNYPVSLDGLVATLETRRNPKTGSTVVRLIDAQKPGEQAEARGEFDLATRNWHVWLDCGSVAIPKQGFGLAMMLGAWGTRDYVRLDQLYVRGQELEFFANGWYVFDRPRPVELDVYVAHLPPRAGRTDAPPVVGFLRGEAHLSGTAAAPRDLELVGRLRANDLTAFDRPIDEVNAEIRGRIDNERAVVRTNRLTMLKGAWDVDASYDAKTRGVSVGVKVDGLPLAEVGQFLKRDDFTGKLSGQWAINVARPQLNAIDVDGKLVVTDAKAAGLVADRIDATTKLANGRLVVDPIQLTRTVTRAAGDDEVTVNGRTDATARMELARPKRLVVSMAAASWPVEIGPAAWVDVSGGTPELTVDLAAVPEKGGTEALPWVPKTLSVAGNLQFTANMSARGTPVAEAFVLASLLGREADVRKVSIKSFGGDVEGQGLVDFDYPLDARASLDWANVDARLLADLFPAAVGLDGTYGGSLRLEPSKNPRALAPLSLTLRLDADGGRYREIQFGALEVNAYTDLKRLVLADLAEKPSTIEVAGGVIELWGRFSSHAADDTRNVVSSQMTLRLKDLDLDQIVHTGSPDADPMPGRINGTITLIGATRPLRESTIVERDAVPAFLERLSKAFSAQGRVELSRANLANVDAFSSLYNLMNLGRDMSTPTGSGTVDVRLEEGTLYAENLRYFNRGTEIRAMAAIEQVWRLPQSPVSGTAVGVARPLADVKLPLFSEFDRILTLAQPTSVAIGGTVVDPTVRPLAFREVGDAMRAFFLGDAKAATKK